MPITGITKSVVMGSQEVEDKYGITPSQVIDYKALVGDPSDNYPGVAGIGPKTASSLLQKFGTLENIYSHLGDMKPELSQKLAKDAEAAALCKKLATIHLDAPVHLDTKNADVARFTPEKFLDVFEQFNIHSLARRLSGLGEEKQVLKKQNDGGTSVGANKKIEDKKKSDEQLELL